MVVYQQRSANRGKRGETAVSYDRQPSFELRYLGFAGAILSRVRRLFRPLVFHVVLQQDTAFRRVAGSKSQK